MDRRILILLILGGYLLYRYLKSSPQVIAKTSGTVQSLADTLKSWAAKTLNYSSTGAVQGNILPASPGSGLIQSSSSTAISTMAGGIQLIKQPQTRQEIKKAIVQTADKYKIPADMFLAQMLHESASTLNPTVMGDGGDSYGIPQINKPAHPDFNTSRALGTKTKPPDVNYQLDYAAKLLSGLYKQTGNWYDALRRYNGSGSATYRYADTITQRARTQDVQRAVRDARS